jgi:hypothetical protein
MCMHMPLGAVLKPSSCAAAAAAAAAAGAGAHSLNVSPFGPRISVSGRSMVTVVVVTMPARALLAALSRSRPIESVEGQL